MLYKEWFYKRFDTSLINPDATDEDVVKFVAHCKMVRDVCGSCL